MRPACAGLTWEHENAPERNVFLSSAFSRSALHNLCHKATHRLSGFVLFLPCGVGVGAEGELGIVVAQHGRYRFYIHAVLESCGGEGVA